MAQGSDATRAPRGTKPVVAAFFLALNEVPEPRRAAVMKAAVAAIRDGIRANRGRPTGATARAKAPAVSVQKAAAPKKKASVAKRALSAKKAAPKKTAVATRHKTAPKGTGKKSALPKQKAPPKKAAPKAPAPDRMAEHSSPGVEPPPELEDSVEF